MAAMMRLARMQREDDAAGAAEERNGAEAGEDGGDAGEAEADEVDDEHEELGFTEALSALVRQGRPPAADAGQPVHLQPARDVTAREQYGGATPASVASAASTIKIGAAAYAGTLDGRARLAGAFKVLEIPADLTVEDPRGVLYNHAGRDVPSAATASQTALAATPVAVHYAGKDIGLARILPPGDACTQRVLIATSVGPGVAGRASFLPILVSPDLPTHLVGFAAVVVAKTGTLAALIAAVLEMVAHGYSLHRVCLDCPCDMSTTVIEAVCQSVFPGKRPYLMGPRADSTVLTIAGSQFRPVAEGVLDIAASPADLALVSGCVTGRFSRTQVYVAFAYLRQGVADGPRYLGVMLENTGCIAPAHPGVELVRHQAKFAGVLPLQLTINAPTVAHALQAALSLRFVRRATTVCVQDDLMAGAPASQTIQVVTYRDFIALPDEAFEELSTVQDVFASLKTLPVRVRSDAWRFTDGVQRSAGERPQMRLVDVRPAAIHMSVLREGAESSILTRVIARALVLQELTLRVAEQLRSEPDEDGRYFIDHEAFKDLLYGKLERFPEVLAFPFGEAYYQDPAHLAASPAAQFLEACLAIVGFHIVGGQGRGPKRVLAPKVYGPVPGCALPVYTRTARVQVSTPLGPAPAFTASGVNLIFRGEACMITPNSAACDPITLAEVLCWGLARAASPKVTCAGTTVFINLSVVATDDAGWLHDRGTVARTFENTSRMAEVVLTKDDRTRAVGALLDELLRD